MTLTATFALFGTMLVLAAMPSLSVLTVTARSLSGGFIHGVATAIGIVAGDLIFVLIAILGLGVLADSLGDYFDIIKLIGGLYLLYLAYGMYGSHSDDEAITSTQSTLAASFMAGLMLTLADQKAILFYLVLFPAFLDLQQLDSTDIAIIVAVTIITVGGVKIIYAALAGRLSVLRKAGVRAVLNSLAVLAICAVAIHLLSSWYQSL